MSNNWNLIGRDRAGMIEKLRKNDFRKKPCMKPFREITIGHDGHAYICCEVFPNIINKNYRVGNIDEKNIFDIYASSKLYEFRRALFCFGKKKIKPCSYCSDEDNSSENSSVLRESILKSSKPKD